jgi:hypothetical protein
MFPNVVIEHRTRIVEPIASAIYLITQVCSSAWEQMPILSSKDFLALSYLTMARAYLRSRGSLDWQ